MDHLDTPAPNRRLTRVRVTPQNGAHRRTCCRVGGSHTPARVRQWEATLTVSTCPCSMRVASSADTFEVEALPPASSPPPGGRHTCGDTDTGGRSALCARTASISAATCHKWGRTSLEGVRKVQQEV
eukprot:1130660-Prorocentrum_minimum.AAC.12